MGRTGADGRGNQRVALFSAGMAGVAALLLTFAVEDLGEPQWMFPITASEPLQILVLGAIFALTESFVVHLQFRRQSQSFSLSEVPFIVGLFSVAPVVLLAARLLGSLVALVGRRRQPSIKVAFNLSYFLFDTAVMLALFQAVVGTGEILGPRAWAGAHLAGAVSIVTGTSAVAFAIWLTERTAPRGAAHGVITLGLPTVFVNVNFGLMTVLLFDLDPRAGVLLCSSVLAIFFLYRSHTQLRASHETLGELYKVTRTVDDALEHGGAIHTLLEQTADVLRAEYAELVVTSPTGECVRYRWSAHEQEFSTEPAEDMAKIHNAVLEGQSSVLLTQREHAASLGAIGGYEEAIVLRLKGDGHLTGTLLIGDRIGDVASFTENDRQIFETLGNHASIAMRNSSLLERLRVENQEREYEACHDSLTGLANRAYFDRSVAEALEARHPDDEVTVLLIDLDRFKEVNDTLGHHHGDVLLRHVASKIAATVGDAGLVARFGGDEFAILLPDACDPHELASQVRTEVAAPFFIEQLPMAVNASIGIASVPEDAMDAMTLMQRVDVAMYSAKRGNGIARYREDDNNYSPARLAMVAELRQAIERGELLVEYQPSIDVATGAMVGAEALARWHHPRRGYIPPDEFIGIAERSGLIHELTTFVLRTAVRQCSVWRREGLPIGVSVNISARSLADDEFAVEVAEALLYVDLPPAALTLEITESTIMDDPEQTIRMLNRLSTIGVTLSIDDYGTGYSSLAYLKNLPVDELKLDRSFVTHMTDDHRDQVIVRNSIELAHELGLRVVAEGIEDASTLATLRDLGCDIAQGYHIARPCTSASLLVFGRDRRRSGQPISLAEHRAARPSAGAGR